MTPSQVEDCARRNVLRRTRLDAGTLRTSDCQSAINDVDALIVDLLNERDRRELARQQIRDLEHSLSESRRHHAACMHTVTPLRRKLAAARKLLRGVSGFSPEERQLLRDVNRD
jgi:hypothetical protein